MKVAKIINNEIELHDIYLLYPNVSFPDVGIPDDFLTQNNLYKVIESLDFDPSTQYINFLNKPILNNGYVYTVELKNRTNEEIINNKWIEVRKQRGLLLSESDKYVLLDLWENYSEQMKNDVKNYRKKLRDVPQDNNDPFNIIWPTKYFN
jgi:hypothetical protein